MRSPTRRRSRDAAAHRAAARVVRAALVRAVLVRAALVPAGAAVAALAVTACSATADVAVTETSPAGAGTVAVTVTLDPAAEALVGGLAQQIDTAGLGAEGWVVGAVRTTPGGGASVEATHGFATPAGLQQVLDEVVGSPGSHLLTLALTEHPTRAGQTVGATGEIDLRCGLDCFGDAGLRAATGSTLGVSPAALAPGEASVDLSLTLPGTPGPSDATTVRGRTATWTGSLGATVPIADTATIEDRRADVRTAGWAAAGVLAAVAVAVVVVAVALRRGRRRRASAGGVTPPS